MLEIFFQSLQLKMASSESMASWMKGHARDESISISYGHTKREASRSIQGQTNYTSWLLDVVKKAWILYRINCSMDALVIWNLDELFECEKWDLSNLSLLASDELQICRYKCLRYFHLDWNVESKCVFHCRRCACWKFGSFGLEE